MKTAGVLALIVAASSMLACGPPGCGFECNPYKPPPAAQYDLILTEADSGTAGVSTGQGIAFILDARRDQLITTPVFAVGTTQDAGTRPPGKRVFTLPAGQYGVFDVTATGPAIAPFTFHLTIGHLLPFLPRATVVRRGDLVVQQYPVSLGSDYQSTALGKPTFELVQDVVNVGAAGELLKSTPAPARRAYRALQLGTQVVSSNVFTTYRVVVAGAPPAFQVFVDSETRSAVSMAVGESLAVVLAGDVKRVFWAADPADAFVRLPSVDVGQQPRGATLVPFRVMVEGPVSLTFEAVSPASPAITVAIQSGQTNCLPDDLPRYPLAHMTSSGGPPCLVNMESTDSTARILAFYRTALSQGDWGVGAGAGSPIAFFRRSNRSWGGSVDVAGGVITIRTAT